MYLRISSSTLTAKSKRDASEGEKGQVGIRDAGKINPTDDSDVHEDIVKRQTRELRGNICGIQKTTRHGTVPNFDHVLIENRVSPCRLRMAQQCVFYRSCLAWHGKSDDRKTGDAQQRVTSDKDVNAPASADFREERYSESVGGAYSRSGISQETYLVGLA